MIKMLESIFTSKCARRLVASLPRGKSRSARFIAKHYPKARVYALVKQFSGISLYLDTSDPFQAEIAYGSYQSSFLKRLSRLVRPGDFVLTAGAHVGYIALALSKLVGANGRVIAFEADPRMVEACKRNFALNAAYPVHLIPEALGSATGELSLSLSSILGQSSLAIAHHHVAYVTVPVRIGDHALEEIGVHKIDGLVLDAEGWEKHILEGLSRTMANHLPDWAIVECWDVALRGAGSSAAELRDYLGKLGWELSAIDGGTAVEGDIVCRVPRKPSNMSPHLPVVS
jgi:FkbM family methyltransferase